ncbi:hypothetical protein [Paraburkholderia kururiensis]|uniref:Uncharacterized protein n=1 Tax=Paraburkholderia kururiensis TaxID=984307 RepID=A0ABZ0WRP0_9BURK|nr:hypothetical protein [Paraburkholderia kururiensis]WQD80032.1 hypothetical protein U0042_10295 [Paraburkholderia kururiensis]
MKTSTLMTAVLLSASCFAAPVHTARESLADLARSPAFTAGAAPGYAAPVAPPAPDVPIDANIGPQRWQHIALPPSRHLGHFVAPHEHLQT